MTTPINKVCVYKCCEKPFLDTTPNHRMRYCSEECRYRAKTERSGKVSPEGFLKDRVVQCPHCKQDFTPTRGNQEFCTPVCREAAAVAGQPDPREKVCARCGLPFRDESPKVNRRSHAACSAKAWGHKPNPGRSPEVSPRTEEARRQRVWHGDGGRIDQINTLRKFTHTWWGRVSELVFAAYRLRAVDMNASHGNRSPYDFDDPELGKVDVRGAQERMSPQGRPAWQYMVTGLKESCNYVFLVGYSQQGAAVQHLWLVPVGDVGESAVRLAPGSKEYQGAKWEVSGAWGLVVGNEVLAKYRGAPEPVRPEDRFAWMDDPINLLGDAPGRKGRRGEILYQLGHPDSRDMNRENGSTSPYDFEDADGTKVNVKAARLTAKKGSLLSNKWSFTQGPDVPVQQPDVYSCLCLDAEGVRVLREYRIPPAAWPGRTIHIYEGAGGRPGQWEKWRVGGIGGNPSA